MPISAFINRNNPALWLEFIDYANRLFNQNQPTIWSNPVTFLSVYNQGQSLLRSDVLSIPVLPFYTNWIMEHPEEKSVLKEKKLKIIFKKILSLETPKQNIQEILKGICHSYKNKHPIVLIVPSPQLWLMEAARLTDQTADTIDENLVDAASLYIADYLRSFSEAGLDAIVLEEAHESFLPSNEIEALYQPVMNVAQHYQWELGYWGKNKEITPPSFSAFYFSPGNQVQGENALCMLHESWWHEAGGDRLPSETFPVFGAIPKDAIPEMVLSKIKEAKMTTI